MNVEELLRSLEPYGLEATHARVYFHLTQSGPARAAAIAKRAGLRRPDAYPVLSELERRGFVERTVEKPARFVAVPLERALEFVLSSRAQEVARLRETAPDLVARWPRGAGAADGGGARVAVVQGRDQLQALVARMLGSAQEDVLVVTGRRGLHRLGLRKGASVPKGVRLRILTSVSGRAPTDLTPLRAAAQVRHAEIPSTLQVLIVDNREVALFVGQEEGEDAALWAASHDLAMAQRGLLDSFWEHGIQLGQRVGELEGGARAPQVAVLRGRWVRMDRLRKMVGSCRRSFVSRAPAVEYHRWGERGVWDEIRRLQKAGVTIDLESDGPVDPPAGVPELRVGRPGALAQFVADGQHVLLVGGAQEDPQSPTSDAEWSVYATQPDFLDAFAGAPRTSERRPPVRRA